MNPRIQRATMVIEFDDGSKRFIPCDFLRGTELSHTLSDIGGIEVRQDSVLLDGEPLDFIETHYRLLRLMWEAQGGVVTRDEIAEAVWPEAACRQGVSEQAIDAVVRRTRRNLARYGARCQIVTVRGRGHRLEPL